MNKELKRFLAELSQSVIFWVIALVLWGLFRMYGIGDEEGIILEESFNDAGDMTKVLPLFTVFGLLVGILFSSAEFLFEKYSSKRMSVGVSVLIKTLIHFILIVLIATTTIELAIEIYGVGIDNSPGWWIKNKVFRVMILYILIASLVYSFIRIANEKFGKGVFLKILMGRYKEPKEEKRIFMFLDLKSSTTIAERLGHFKYSQLIQDCFYDLNEIVPRYSAEIYQYVGDEAIMSWDYKKGLAENNCIALFFEYQRLLLKKKKYYEDKYGQSPEFKAGLHGGKLMVAEVGVIKKELAFHGDVINTSARIQGECNKYQVPILISEELKSDLPRSKKYRATEIGNVLLKGKIKSLNIYTVVSSI